jgi:hypothetical protein
MHDCAALRSQNHVNQYQQNRVCDLFHRVISSLEVYLLEMSKRSAQLSALKPTTEGATGLGFGGAGQ